MKSLLARTILSAVVFFGTFTGVYYLINKKVDWFTAITCAIVYGITTYIMTKKREKNGK